MSDPVWASVFGTLRSHAELALGIALGLLSCAFFVRLVSRRRSARRAAVGLWALATLELGLDAVVRFLPLVNATGEPSPERDALLAAAFQRVEVGVIVVVGAALVGAVLCSRNPHGFRFSVLVFALGIAGQALWLEVGVREVLVAIQRSEEHREIARRAIAKCLETEELQLGRANAESLAASVLEKAPPKLGVERVSVRRQRVFDSFPYHCLVAENDVWCFGYSTPSPSPLEKLVREHPFTSVARDMTDSALVDWVAFALGVYVWQPSSTRSATDGRATPARVDRMGSRLRLDFWERHPLIPGFGVQLRHTEVVLDGRTVTVTRGPMSETFRLDWDRDSL